jgi:ABC-type branched-subunit amino acid transport system substrate-binding protein
VAEINEQGGIHGRKLKLLIEDNGYDPKKTVLATQKLVNQEKIFAMVGLMGTAAAVAAMPIILDKNVISFMPMSSAREMFEPVHKLKFGFAPPNFDSLKVTAPQVYQATKSTKACALYQDDEFGLEVVRGAEAGLKTINVELRRHDPVHQARRQRALHRDGRAARPALALDDAGVDYAQSQQAYVGYVYGDSTAASARCTAWA